MTATVCLSLGSLLADFRHRTPPAVLSAVAAIADRRIAIECDDERLFSEFFVMFGGSAPVPGRIGRDADMHVEIHAAIHDEFGWFRMSGTDELPVDAHEFSFALTAGQGTFEVLSVDEAGWKCFAFRGSDVPAFAFRGRDCIFALDAQWRRTIMWYLFWRLLRIRSDAIFFHASSVGISGEGAIFVGPSGGGKSTTALALAARGHNFLGDEIAGYVPARGELIPFRRPVGIKPGPRAAAVERSLATGEPQRIARDRFVSDQFLRVAVEQLLRVDPPRVVPLRRIVFLRGFAQRPLLERIAPGRSEIVELQPLMSSFLNASHGRRVFELARLLSNTRVYALQPADPDATALYLEQELARE